MFTDIYNIGFIKIRDFRAETCRRPGRNIRVNYSDTLADLL